MTSSDSCQWFEGSFQVVCRGKGSGPMGPMTSLGVMAYSAADKGYTYYGIDNMGHERAVDRQEERQHLDVRLDEPDWRPILQVTLHRRRSVADLVYLQVGDVGRRHEVGDVDGREIDEGQVVRREF